MSFYLPTALRLLKDYRDGVAKQVVILSQNDFSDSKHVSRGSIRDDSDYRKCKKILNNVNNEIEILESL